VEKRVSNMDPQLINGALTAIVGFFVSRVLKKVDDIDLAAKSISTDVALIKQDRQLIWDKINRMEEDLEELKRLMKQD
jgi:uncharacterized protein YoxC